MEVRASRADADARGVVESASCLVAGNRRVMTSTSKSRSLAMSGGKTCREDAALDGEPVARAADAGLNAGARMGEQLAAMHGTLASAENQQSFHAARAWSQASSPNGTATR